MKSETAPSRGMTGIESLSAAPPASGAVSDSQQKELVGCWSCCRNRGLGISLGR